ncbi:MAG: PEP-CTERM sorting domain-containing protein [Cyanobacteria bacterium P01_A01_bin.114]
MSLKVRFSQGMSVSPTQPLSKTQNSIGQRPVKQTPKQALKQTLLLFAPMVAAGSTFWASPSLAASFAFSEASAFLSNFNQIADASDSFANSTVTANTINPGSNSANPDAGASVQNSMQNTVAEGFADYEIATLFSEDAGNSFISNYHVNEAFGDGTTFLSRSETDTAAIVDFFINPRQATSEIFSFDLSLSLFLETTVMADSATASGDISIEVCGSEGLGTAALFCDSLSVSGLRQNTGENDFSVQASSAFSVEQDDFFEDTAFAPGLAQDTQQLDFFAVGAYQRAFTTPIFLTLTETKVTKAEVVAAKTPEPSGVIGVILGTGLVFGRARRRKLENSIE